MNAVVVLCHFCEQHGPSVVMCTQPYRQLPTRVNGSEHNSADSVSSIKRATSHAVLHGTGGGSGDNGLHLETPSGPLIFAAGTSNSGTVNAHKPSGTTQQSSFTRGTCRACSFTTRDEPGLVSQDQAANITYNSTQFPKDPDLQNFVRTACQRSLSCEVCPDTEGAFYFGDETNGHAVSYNFDVKDAQARGFQSRYSIIVLSWDRLFLLSLWPFLVLNLSKMAARIKVAAERVYSAETSEKSGTSGPKHSTHHFGREATPPALFGHAGAASVVGVSTMGGGPAVRHRRAVDADMRSLCDLTKDEKMFYRIHAWFTWLLRAGARHWTALPSLTGVPDEDSLVEQEERQSVGSDPLLYTSHRYAGYSQASSGAPIPPVGSVGSATIAVGKFLGVTNGTKEEETALSLLVLARMMHSLGPRPFSFLVQHVVVGNQIIVQPFDDDLDGCVVVAALAKLLPRGCRKQIVASPEYLPAFRCNLLSLTVDAQAPDADWTPSEGMQFLAVCRDQSPSSAQVAAPDERLVSSFHFRLCSTIPSIDPQLQPFRQPSAKELGLTFSSLPFTPVTSIPVGMFAARVVQLLSMQPQPPASALDLALSSARLEWVNRARLLYSFKRCQGPTLVGDEATRRWTALLATIDCSAPENANVVRFFQGALSQYSRRNTCHSHRRAAGSSNTSRKGSCCSSNADLSAAIAAASITD